MVKKRFCVSVDKELVDWMDLMVKEKKFSSRSHAVEFCVKRFTKIPKEKFMKCIFCDLPICGTGKTAINLPENHEDAI